MGLGAARVIYTIQDLSLYIDQLLRGYVIAIVEAERGPLWEPTPVTSWDEYERLFGRTFDGSTDPLVLKTGLQQGAKFLVIRIVNCTDTSDPSSMTASAASVTLVDRNDSATPGSIRSDEGPFNIVAREGGSHTGSEAGDFTFSSGVNDDISLKVWGEASSQDVTLVGANQTAAEVAAQINAGTTGITASVVSGAGAVEYVKVKANPVQVDGTVAETFAITTDSNDKVKVKVGGAASQTFTLTQGATQTAQDIADDINATAIDLTASDDGSGHVRLTCDNDGDSLEIEAVTYDAYSTLGFSTGTTSASLEIVTCSTDAYDVLGWTVGVYSAIEGTDRLVVAVDGGSDQTFVLSSGLTRTAYQIATEIMQSLSGATAYSSGGKLTIVSDTSGASSSVQVQTLSTADTPLGFDNSLHSGSDSGTPQNTLTFNSKNPGAWSNYLKVHIYEADLNPGTAFDVRISYSNQGGLNEYFAELDMDPTSDRYCVDYINERSRLVEVEDEDSSSTGYKNRPAENEDGSALTGGGDGNALTDADYIGDENAQTGMYAADKTDLSIDIMIPGSSSNTVIAALAAYCENRGDLVGYAQIPAGLDPGQAEDWRMGNSPYSHEAFNSHRLALFFGRPLVYESRTDSKKYIPALGMLAACISKTDTYYNYSYAPVGPRRGTVDFVEGLDFNLGDYPGYQDEMAEFQINSLIISRKQGIEGAVFWEQYTTQRAASALRDLNVVRFLTMMKKVLLPALRMFLFEPNHPDTWRELHRTIEPQLQLWKAQSAIYDYYLQTDRDAWFDGGELVNAVLNTGLEIDQGIYHARVLVQPTRAIRYLMFECGVMRTGEAFSNYTEMKTLPGWARR